MPQKRAREHTVSVYGEVEARKVQRVKSYTRKSGIKVRSYRRTITVREQRRWDLRGTRHDLGRAVAHIKRTRAAPKVRHKRIRARTFLKRPEKWSDKWELEYPRAGYERRRR
jgi:hypothetical protein